MSDARLPQRLFWVLTNADGMVEIIDGRLPVYLSPAEAQEALAKLANAKLEVKPIILKVTAPEESPRPQKPKGSIPYS